MTERVPMFGLSSPQWAGLGKVLEETSELNDVLSKIVGNGGLALSFDGTKHLAPILYEELGDVLAAIEFFIEHNNLDTEIIDKRKQYKVQLYQDWRDSFDV